MAELFGTLPNGEKAFIYTIRCGALRACVTDLGASLMRLYAPDSSGSVADVVLGYDSAEGILNGTSYIGGTIGRCANRIGGANFPLNGREIKLPANENGNCLHSGAQCYHLRHWEAAWQKDDAICFRLKSPAGDQGFPGNADIKVTYSFDGNNALHIVYEAVADADTVFNMTNHSYFNLAGHEHPERAMDQLLTLPARVFTPADAQSIPTGEIRSVEGTPMDFRVPKPIGRDIGEDYEPLKLQGGYDHNFEVFCAPCATLCDPVSGRTMTISTDCPGLQFYSGNFLHEQGKDGVFYGKHAGVALEPQFYPDALHHPEWAQPIVPAGERYHSETVYRFTW